MSNHIEWYGGRRGGLMVSVLVPGRVVRVRALAGDIVLCSWARHSTLTVPLSTQVYKWVPVNYWGKPNKLLGNDLQWTSILSRGSRNTPSRPMLQKPGISSGSYGPLGSKGFILSDMVICSYCWRGWVFYEKIVKAVDTRVDKRIVAYNQQFCA